MNILYIITQADGGGAQKYVLSMAKYFGGTIAAGHSTLRDEPSGSGSKSNEATQLFIDAKNLGIPCIELTHLKRSINPLEDLQAVWEIRKLIQSERPDVIHLNSSKAGIIGSFAAIGLKTKVVFTAHGFIFNEPMSAAKQAFYLALEKTASSYRNFIITVSDADKQSALANNLIAPEKIQTVHNGIGQIEFLSSDEAKKILGLTDNKFIIGSVANFYKTKGLDVLISAVNLLPPNVKEKVSLVIAGDGRERANLEKQIASLNLQSTVKLLGFSSLLPKAIKAFDIFVLASRKEGLPYTLLEAMQAGMPIIATSAGGNPEAIGNAGILVQPENPKVLADALQNLFADASQRHKLSALAVERSKLFTEQKMFEETEKIYRKIV